MWVGASCLCIHITHALGCARVAVFKKQQPTSLSQRHSVNDLYILLSSETFHDLLGNLLGKVQLSVFSGVRSPTYKQTKSMFTSAFMHFLIPCLWSPLSI